MGRMLVYTKLTVTNMLRQAQAARAKAVPHRGGKRLPHRERHEAILRAAIRLFAERGYHGATTRELAAAAGVSEPILYRHFPTKQDLYSAIIEYKAETGIAELEHLLRPHAESRDDRGFFTELGRFVLSRYRQDPSYARLLLFSALERHGLAQIFYDRQVAVHYQQVGGYLRQRMREGVLRTMKPNVAARAFLGMVNHHALVGLLFRDYLVPEDVEAMLEALVSIFLKGMQRT